MSGPMIESVQRMGQGMAKLSDANPTNDMEGVRDIASGALNALTVTVDRLNAYFNKHSLDISDVRFPREGTALRAQYMNSTDLTNDLLKASVSHGLREALREETPEEKKQRVTAETEKKAQEKQDELRRIAARVEAAKRDQERRDFVNGKDNIQEKESLAKNSKSNPKGSLSLV